MIAAVTLSLSKVSELLVQCCAFACDSLSSGKRACSGPAQTQVGKITPGVLSQKSPKCYAGLPSREVVLTKTPPAKTTSDSTSPPRHVGPGPANWGARPHRGSPRPPHHRLRTPWVRLHKQLGSDGRPPPASPVLVDPPLYTFPEWAEDPQGGRWHFAEEIELSNDLGQWAFCMRSATFETVNVQQQLQELNALAAHHRGFTAEFATVQKETVAFVGALSGVIRSLARHTHAGLTQAWN